MELEINNGLELQALITALNMNDEKTLTYGQKLYISFAEQEVCFSWHDEEGEAKIVAILSKALIKTFTNKHKIQRSVSCK